MSPDHLAKPENLYTLVCRPALPQDTKDVMELTRTIWEGHDYVPSVWGEWLHDPSGLLVVAEYGSRVVGLGKITRLVDKQWWLEGLRVHPNFEGRHIASHIHDYQLNYWQRTGEGVIRLATASFRKPIQHLCDRTGFKKKGEFTPFIAPAIDEPVSNFQPLVPADIPRALDFLSSTTTLSIFSNMMDLGWKWASPESEFLIEPVRRGWAWWWLNRQGLLVVREETDEGETSPFVSLLACPLSSLEAYLLDYLRLVSQLGYDQAGWIAQLHPDLQPILQSVGFQRDWEDAIYIYEKTHPTKSLDLQT